jgi:hypothetical protein
VLSPRKKSIAFSCLLLSSTLACTDEPATDPAPAQASVETPSSPAANPGVNAIDLPPPAPSAEDEDESESEPEPEIEPEQAAASETGSPVAEPSDPLAPILPDAPEPGSPESDAELAALLDESTITQDEFDKAFRGVGPNIQDDQFVFGPNDRKRAQPVLGIGTPRVVQGKVTVAELEALVRADERKLLSCYAVALTDAPTLVGAPTLHLRFEPSSSTPTATIAGADGLPRALTDCLLTVAKSWRPAAAAGAKLEIPLTLSTK